MCTIHDITNVVPVLDHRYDHITNPQLLAKLAIIYASLAACSDEEAVALLYKARRALCKEINRLLGINTVFIRTSYFNELAHMLALFCTISNEYDSKRLLRQEC